MLDIQAIVEQIASFDFSRDESQRIFHGRGHCFEGLHFINVDWFKPVIWVVVYGEQDASVLENIQQALVSAAEASPHIQTIAFQQRLRGKSEQAIWYGELAETVYAQELGAKFELELSANQNIGFFLDAKPARQWLRQQAKGKRVLNMFSYTCAFSVIALQDSVADEAEGAAHVVNIDMAKGPIAQGQRNHALNDIALDRVSYLPHDVFRSMRNLEKRGPYDIVVIDPPSKQRKSFEADKDYLKLLKKLSPLLSENATVVALLNAPFLDEQFLPAAFAEALPELQYLERLPQRPDFPEQDLNRCLKMQLFQRQSS